MLSLIKWVSLLQINKFIFNFLLEEILILNDSVLTKLSFIKITCKNLKK